MKHKHHIVPRHIGGTDDPDNIVEVSVEEHAELHLSLYLTHGRKEDYIAYHLLAGLGDEGEELRLLVAHTPEANAKRSKAQLGKKRGPYNVKVQNKAWFKKGSPGRKPAPVKVGDKIFKNMKEAAKHLGVHVITAYRMRSEGRL